MTPDSSLRACRHSRHILRHRWLLSLGAVVLLLTDAAGFGCRREFQSPELASLLIHLDGPLGSDLQLAGLSIAAQPDRKSWLVTVYSRVLRVRNPRPRLWVHAYPPAAHEYFTMVSTGAFPSASAGEIVKDGFLLERAGAFNLYIGVTGGDGSYGPAFGLGWIGVGDPDTPEYHRAYRFLQEADDARAEAMLVQTKRDYPKAQLP